MRTCNACKHPDRDAINAALLGTESLRKIAARWSVSKSALLRHKAAHLPPAIVKAAAVKEEISGSKLHERLMALHRETASILSEARTADTKDNQLALKAIARLEQQIRFQGELLTQLNEHGAVDLTSAPEWHSLRGAILLALEPHPAARAAVLQAIEREEAVNDVAA